MAAQLDMFPQARAQRDEALARVAANAGTWWPRAIAQAGLVIGRHAGELMTGEQLRFLIAPKAGEPHHHNTWGSLIGELIEAGALVPTGKWVAMEGPKSHARQTRLYRLSPPH